MARSHRGNAGGSPPARMNRGQDGAPAGEAAGPAASGRRTVKEGVERMSPFEAGALQAQWRRDGITVTGEALRRASLEGAEFLIEISASAPTAAQALRDTQAKTTHTAQALSAAGITQTDLQTISFHLQNLYSPASQALPGFGGAPQIGQTGFVPYGGATGLQPEVQFGSYQGRNVVRVNVRDPARVGEVADAAGRAGANIIGSFCFKTTDEAAARRAALEAAARDARSKAEALAAAAGTHLGEPVAVSEDVIATNGAYAALRSALPFAFGAGAPQVAGELEYYARVSATFSVNAKAGVRA